MINRITPQGQPREYLTYSIVALPDLSVVAACHEVGCESWRNGWDTTVDVRTPLGAAQAQYIRTKSGRTFREMATELGLVVFRFDSGQRCFAEHRTQPEIFSRNVGWQDVATEPAYVHKTPADWQEDFGEHQDRIAEEYRKG